MKKGGKSLEEIVKLAAKKFLETKNKEIQVISHNDTDGITSATIMIQSLKKLDKNFSIQIIKNLETQFIQDLPKTKTTIFLDLASNHLETIQNSGLKDVFIIDHHLISKESSKKIKKINIINPELHGKQKMSSSCLTYLFCRELKTENKKLAKLAILGMIGDRLEKEINHLNNQILKDSEIKIKRGLLIYPSTRPINRTLEYSSYPYIPGVTGNPKGVTEILRETNLNPKNGKCKSILELNKEEMEKLTTSIMLRNPKSKNEPIIGDIFLIKLFNKLEDARELSAMVNACSRLGHSDLAVQLLMENPNAKKKAESIYIKYKQYIISGLKFVSEIEKIQGKDFMIINAQDQIKDTIIGTIASILSSSSIYEEGTIIVTMALNEIGTKIKISARNVGRNGRNVRELLAKVINVVGGEVGGHEFAAGGLIDRKKEHEFIMLLKKNLEIELVKI